MFISFLHLLLEKLAEHASGVAQIHMKLAQVADLV
jgi:hypothetical protein